MLHTKYDFVRDKAIRIYLFLLNLYPSMDGTRSLSVYDSFVCCLMWDHRMCCLWKENNKRNLWNWTIATWSDCLYYMYYICTVLIFVIILDHVGYHDKHENRNNNNNNHNKVSATRNWYELSLATTLYVRTNRVNYFEIEQLQCCGCCYLQSTWLISRMAVCACLSVYRQRARHDRRSGKSWLASHNSFSVVQRLRLSFSFLFHLSFSIEWIFNRTPLDVLKLKLKFGTQRKTKKKNEWISGWTNRVW